MKKSLKGALLSALILPGAGQLWLKHYLRGIALMVAVSACLAAVVMKAVRQAITILEQVETEGGTVDTVTLLSSASHSSALPDGFMSASTVLLLCWIIGILDAYLLGAKKDLAEQVSSQRRSAPGQAPQGEAAE